MPASIDLDQPADAALLGAGVIAPVEQRLVLDGIDWDQYEQISDALSGRHVRLTYDCGVLEFMTISPKHGWIAWLIGRLVTVLAEETGTTLRSCGDMTMRRSDSDRGIESDGCFYLVNEPAVRGRDEIDFRVDPPPDLGLEVDLSASSRRRMPVYAALRVPEIWRFSRAAVVIHRLSEQGQYEPADTSRYFPFVTAQWLTDVLSRRHSVDENTLVAQFRVQAREMIAGLNEAAAGE